LVGDARTPVQTSVDENLAAFIAKIQAVDNHAHVNTIEPDDEGADALPLHLLLPFEIPVRLRETSPDWLTAYQALYDYPYSELDDEKMQELMGTMERVAMEHGEKFPEWVLDRVGIEVMLANRLAMGPGLSPPRFRWVSYVDALLLPLSTKAEEAVSPDRAKLFPVLVKQLKGHMAELEVEEIPATLDDYLTTIVTPTLEAQNKGGCIGVKFEVGFLRSLHFDDVSEETASQVYARYAKAGVPSHAEFKQITDFLFRYIAREAGRLGMAVHIHSFNGPGGFYRAAESDPIFLEPVFNDVTLRDTNFVLIHGGGVYANHTQAMLWKPNVYTDISALTRLWPPAQLAAVLKNWLRAFPEKVLFGTDASSFGPGLGWELGAWIATTTGRQALAMALTTMLRNEEVSRARAEEIATMVMRTNAENLYNLGLK
jgi:predicted TIM-barrel fold metal-dependent hydrolase